MINTEVYTYTYKQIFEGISQINYVQLESNSYNALNNNMKSFIEINFKNNI